ncbi:hypothetical protein M4I32_03685 [Microbacterium sp. LRZ72]|uniref:helix-turn-helix transcriptional regulator n=1 Tax=Microbacterium sp. LRZ72 TaxID=2942481 RepID=UPI0029A26CCA|nr:hypothetical protein [Microbacterium sp. LRZ72]MDX2375898.1 hypothetical protein [Microbacterium sp. LRZ72]
MSEQIQDRLGAPPRGRTRVLDVLLSSADPVDAASVAERLHLHVTTARFHLERLTAAGVVVRSAENPVRRGRPRVLYSAATRRGDDGVHAELVNVLALALTTSGADAASTARRAGHGWGGTYGEPDAVEPVGNLVAMLDGMGFSPEHETSPAAILLRSCPFRHAVRQHPDIICSVHRGLIEQRLAGTGIRPRLEPFVETDLCLIALEDTP